MPQPYRGNRTHVSMRVPDRIIDKVDRAAAREGLTRSEYITRFLALQHGEPVPSYIQAASDSHQPRLPNQEARMSA